jgi:hypothetical protein
MHDDKQELTELCLRATVCRWCFNNLNLTAPLIDIAQPRWVGQHYWKASPRVLVLMLNPGSGESRTDDADMHFCDLIHAFADGSLHLDDVFQHQAQDMPNWGYGRFDRFYVTGLGLHLPDVAFGNIAWCPTKGNNYPVKMLRHCFSMHTASLTRILKPNIVLLSGSSTHRFREDVRRELPHAQVIKMLHYAHRKGRDAEQRELDRVRGLI